MEIEIILISCLLGANIVCTFFLYKKIEKKEIAEIKVGPKIEPKVEPIKEVPKKDFYERYRNSDGFLTRKGNRVT